MRKVVVFSWLLLCTTHFVLHFRAQDSISFYLYSAQHSDKYFEKIFKRINKFEAALDKQPEKYIHKIAKAEERLYRKLWNRGSYEAKELFGDVEARYKSFQNNATEQAKRLGNYPKGYSAKLDSLTTSFKFWNQNIKTTNN
jgi:hypothetical protein